METKAKPMDVPAAVRLLNETIGQWRAMTRETAAEGYDLNKWAGLLAADLETMAEAMAVVTDWAP